MVNAKKGISALQMKRDLKVAYKTAWYLNHRIRKAMGLIEEATSEPPSGTVEVDETDIGGKFDKRRKRQRWDEEPVFGIDDHLFIALFAPRPIPASKASKTHRSVQ